MLTPQQIEEIRAKAGAPPIAATAPTAWESISQKLGGAATTPQKPAAPSLGDLAAEQYAGAGKKVISAVTGAANKIQANASKVRPYTSPGSAASRAPLTPEQKAAGLSDVNAVGEAALGTASGFVQSLFAPLTAITQKAADATGVHPLEAFANTEAGKKLNDWAQAHPEAATNLLDAINVGGAVVGAKATPDIAIGDAANAIKGGVSDVHQNISKLLTSPDPLREAAPAVQSGGFIENMRAGMATKGSKVLGALSDQGKPNVIPQAQTSAQRLANKAAPGGLGAAYQVKPLNIYDARVSRHELHMGDIKKPAALSLDGSDIGKGFDQVAKLRQQVGKQLGSELKKTASNPVSITNSIGDFQKELLDNGVTYDAVTKTVVPGAASKFSTADTILLEKYASDLQKLGSNPTMEQVDAFVGRIPKDIKALKATNSITFKTNAERIISNNLQSMRTNLTSAGTKGYAAARKTYSDLTNFLNEGAKHLGAKTQAGNYTRDVSIAKSAVQSLLSNGKKDWLIKLEGLTGRPYLDNIVMSLQAMKDLGDFKGLSLLEGVKDIQDLIKGLTPTPGGIPAKIIGFLGKKGAQALSGSDVERTRAFLKSLK